jgi:multidrug resistance efflux pump
MKDVYLDKKDRVRRWTTGPRLAILCGVALVLLFAPIWQDFVQGRFVLEPVQRAVIRAEVPGVVVQVLAAENQPVGSGAVLVRMRNLQLESAAAVADADVSESSARATQASLHYSGFGAAERERQGMVAQRRVVADEVAHLAVTTPIAGTVVTPRMSDLQGSYLAAGAKIAEVADSSTMVARIYIPEYGIRDVKPGTRARLQMSSRLLPISGTLASLGPVDSAIDPGLTEKAELNGITPPPYYIGLVNIANDGSLREGMTGTAKLLIGRLSLAEMIWRFCRDSFLRRFW